MLSYVMLYLYIVMLSYFILCFVMLCDIYIYIYIYFLGFGGLAVRMALGMAKESITKSVMGGGNISSGKLVS